MKTCRKCGTFFNGNECPPCHKIRSAIYQKKNPEKSRLSSQRFRDSHPGLSKQKAAERRAKNPERVKEINDNWVKRNPEKALEKVIRWQKDNPRKVLEIRARHYAENREKALALAVKWHKEHPEAGRIANHNRRAREKKNGGRLSRGIVEKLFKLQRGKCACCGKPLGDKFHLDHKVPIALGGPNDDSNMQLLTQRCNAQKGSKDPIDFMRARGFLL